MGRNEYRYKPFNGSLRLKVIPEDSTDLYEGYTEVKPLP